MRQLKVIGLAILVVAGVVCADESVVTIAKTTQCESGNSNNTNHCTSVYQTETLTFQTGKSFFIHKIPGMQSIYTIHTKQCFSRHEDGNNTYCVMTTTSEAGNDYIWTIDFENGIVTTIANTFYVEKVIASSN